MIKEVIINKRVLDALLQLYDKNNEKIFFLSGKIKKGIVYVKEIYYTLQSTTFNKVSFTLLNENYIGTVHTHPYSSNPSNQDLMTFNKLGGIHIIISQSGIKCYDKNGKVIPIKVKEIKNNEVKNNKRNQNGDVQNQQEMRFKDLLIYYIIVIFFLIIFLSAVWLLFFFFS